MKGCLFSGLLTFLGNSSPICGGRDNGYLPSQTAVRHISLSSNRIGAEAPEYGPQHDLGPQESHCIVKIKSG